jgi:recombination protein U
MRQAHGDWLEDYLAHLHARYEAQGRALVGKVPTPTRAVRKAGRDGVTFVPIAKGLPDYLGCLQDGRFVAFDAKATKNKTRWRVKTGGARSRGAEHQWDFLRKVHALGGIAFFLVHAYTLEQVFLAVLPFPLAPLSFDNMMEVPQDENGWYDWLATIGG